ncbi:hypothetical protein FN976_20510 [Caenimonas sedimenti]|uniref:Uncharacterized protein n=1 Tax=Caenimonas sedimenti TaxID=2596921 RepID=A0A562ZKK9_9BURK|nr:hypothetical protein [Caenimonas sedimenti]TWO69120.1 hypothetical protein FN976_20510 [Caenimonas sedimenti]
MEHPYTVALVIDTVELPAVRRIEAEKRCAESLERALGGPEAVAESLMAWRSANDSAPVDLDADTMALAARWHCVASQASQDGIRNLGEIAGAHFDFRLQRG